MQNGLSFYKQLNAFFSDGEDWLDGLQFSHDTPGCSVYFYVGRNLCVYPMVVTKDCHEDGSVQHLVGCMAFIIEQQIEASKDG